MSLASSLSPSSLVLPHWFRVFLVILRDTDGRDKALKLVQYGLRTLRVLLQRYPFTFPFTFTIVLRKALSLSFLSTPSTLSTLSALSTLPGPPRTSPIGTGTTRAGVLFEQWAHLISQSRKVMRLFKWCYSVPSLVRHCNEWREQCFLLQQQQQQQQQQKSQQQQQQGRKQVSGDNEEQQQLLTIRLPGSDRKVPFWSTFAVATCVFAIMADMCEDLDWYSKHNFMPSAWNETVARGNIVFWSISVVGDLTLSTRALLSARKRQTKGFDSLAAEALDVAWLNWLKFVSDFCVAVPSYLRVQDRYEGLVLPAGASSAFWATYKLAKTV